MKKSEILKIIKEKESELYLDLKKAQLNFGQESILYTKAVNRWNEIYNLIYLIGEKPDFGNQMNREALELELQFKKQEDE